MNVPHIIIVEELLPEVRRRVARSLRKSGWSQERIASVLGTSQAMVSRYLREEGNCPRSLSRMSEIISRDVTASILSGSEREDLSERFCSLVRSCTNEGMLSTRFRERFHQELAVDCFGSSSGPGQRSRVLFDLSGALKLLQGRDISPLVPAIKVNLAQAIEGAASREEVASFPGRLMERHGRITGALPPEFGASRHLAQTLLWAMKLRPEISAAINLRYEEMIGELLAGSPGLVVLDRGKSTIEDVLSDPSVKDLRFLVDPGDFGLEPCLYIFGRSSPDVAMEALEIMERVEKRKEVKSNE